MKKYWKIVILPLFIAITIGVLYVQLAFAEKSLPQFELVHVAGDEETGKKIIVYGDYEVDNNPVWESFRLSSDGIKYASEDNFLEQFNSFFQPQELEQLLQEERSFMRGKETDPLLFAEDGERIAYAGPANHYVESKEFEVDVLDKESRERISFKVDIPDSGRTDHMYVEQVQLLDDILYVITVNYIMEEKELHVYEVSLRDETIEDQGAIVSGSVHHYFNILHDVLRIQQQENLIVRVENVEWDEDMYASEVGGDEYFIYDLETGEKQVIEVPEEFSTVEEVYMEEVEESDEDVIYPANYTSVGKEELYFITFSSDGMKYYPYRLKENKFDGEREISFDENILSGFYEAYTKGDYLYLYSNTGENGNPKKLFKVDLVSGKIVYEGEIKLTNAPKETHVYNVEIYSIDEKQ